MFEPCLHVAQRLGAVAEIHDAAGAKAGLRLDRPVHPFPEAQALYDQRDLARVAGHLAAPAPVAARLLAGDVALLAQHRRDAALRQEQSRAGADNAAADDDDIRLGRQFLVGRDWIDARRHVHLGQGSSRPGDRGKRAGPGQNSRIGSTVASGAFPQGDNRRRGRRAQWKDSGDGSRRCHRHH